jgi:hypothetical protein
VPKPNHARSNSKDNRVQWSSPWVVGFVLISVLVLTGLLDQGFLYLERLYYAPWSIGDDALTGQWGGALHDGPRSRRVFLTIALRLKRTLSRTARARNVIPSNDVWVIDGRVQLEGQLMVGPSEGSTGVAHAAPYELTGYANHDGSKFLLTGSALDASWHLTVESDSSAWRDGKLPVTVAYVVRIEANAPRQTAGAGTTGAGSFAALVTLNKLKSAAAPHC